MFDDHFEVLLADTLESKNIHYSIRYQVYCEEMGYENKDDFPSEQEFDEYDKHSAHFIVRARKTGQWVGAMRMVFKNEQPLPVETHCRLTKSIHDTIFNRSIEISRLCLVKEIRRRNVDCYAPYGISDDDKETVSIADNVIQFHRRKHIERSIIWGLFRAASMLSERENVKSWYFLGANALARIISKKGFNLQQVGEPCNLNGERIPFEINLREILANPLWLTDFKVGYSLYSEVTQFEASNRKMSSIA
jgi:N-acyl amino acid synthase of PEP-CTERM/exosortase system